jgi:hypothetical protein
VSADGLAFHLGGPGEAGATVNAHYGRDPIVEIYTAISDRYALLHQKVTPVPPERPSVLLPTEVTGPQRLLPQPSNSRLALFVACVPFMPKL